jgi:hypothetical protein
MKLKNIISGLGIILICYMLLRFIERYYHLNNYSEFTIGNVDSVYLDWRNDKKIAFSFEVKGVNYTGTSWYKKNGVVVVGGKYQVKYSSRKPSINELVY